MSITHLLILLVVVVLIFGTKKLRNIGQDLGGAVKGFKEGMKGADETPAPPDDTPQVTGRTIEAEVTKETSSKV